MKENKLSHDNDNYNGNMNDTNHEEQRRWWQWFNLRIKDEDLINEKKVKTILYDKLAQSLLIGVGVCGLSLLLAELAFADFNADNFAKGIADPAKKMFNDYYPVGILIGGGVGAFLNSQGDLRDKMFGFGKGAATAGLVIAGVKAGFGI